MSTEALQSFDSQESAINPQEKQKEAIRQETDRLYSSLDNFSLEQINTLVDNLSSNNPDFKKELTKFQDTNSTRVTEMLKATSNTNEVNEEHNSNFDYFWIDTNKIQEIQTELNSLDLDINVLLEWYKQYIETNLVWLDKKIKDKVKLSITNKVLNLWTEIEKLKWDLESWEDFKNNRWIVNEKIQDTFSFINNELLPSIEVYLKKDDFDFWYFDKDKKIEEIVEMLNADVDDEWNFDEWFFSMQNVFDYDSDIDKKVLDANWIKKVESISLLNDKDIKIEKQAQYTFFALLAVQIWAEFTPAWWTVWWAIDWYDLFSDNEALIELWQTFNLIDKDYKTEKIWIDNLLAGIWLVPWVTVLTKWDKLYTFLKKMWPEDKTFFMQLIDKVWEKLWIVKEKLNSIKDFLWKWNEKIKWKTKIIDREHLIEDIPRQNLEIREIKEFQKLTEKQIFDIDLTLQEVIWDMKYNSFEKLEKIITILEKKKWPWYWIIDALKEADLWIIDINKWSNCVWMSYVLQKRLNEKWINSNLIRFDAGWLLSDKYVENWHAALIIPRIINWEKAFTLADPWLLISESITFNKWKASRLFSIWEKSYIIKVDEKNDLPYVMEINSKKRLSFDPYNEWINPNETINKDIIRALPDYKIVKQNNKWEVSSFFKTDIEKWVITLNINKKSLKLTYDEFLQIKEDKELYKIFSNIMIWLWEKPEDFFNINEKVISNIDLIKNELLAPSARKNLNSKK